MFEEVYQGVASCIALDDMLVELQVEGMAIRPFFAVQKGSGTQNSSGSQTL